MSDFKSQKQLVIQQLKCLVKDNIRNLWDDETFREYYFKEMDKEIKKVEAQLNDFFDALQYFNQWYSKDKQYSLVLPRKGGKYSLFCYTCRRWIPDTSNYEMQREGVYSHDHFCTKENGEIKIYMQEGIPEKEGLIN